MNMTIKAVTLEQDGMDIDLKVGQQVSFCMWPEDQSNILTGTVIGIETDHTTAEDKIDYITVRDYENECDFNITLKDLCNEAA